MTDGLQSRARAALASRGVKHPDPLQVVAEMQAIQSRQERREDASDFLAGFRRTVFGE